MRKIKIESVIRNRLVEFIDSDCFAVQREFAKSEYWKHHADQLSTEISEKHVSISGDSGFYAPLPSSVLPNNIRRILRALSDPRKIISWINHLVKQERLMSYEKAFDAVMSHSEVSDPELSRFRINHLQMSRRENIFANTKAVSKHYQHWSGCSASIKIINQYYYQNILRNYIDASKTHTVMEIGAGNGNLPSILFHDWAPIRSILVDLPETLAVAIPFISGLFPQAKLVMPHEINSGGLPSQYDFAFLTVDQLDSVADNSVDLSINCHSFQEMTHKQIQIYFDLIHRVTRESGFFFTANRVDKIPSSPDAHRVEQPDPPNRFADYPWCPKNEILIYEISRLARLCQLDDIYLRLECIHR
jgi:putative sugar O-methyltransferase